MRGEAWFYVGDNDIFPETFLNFLAFDDEQRATFMRVHGEILTRGFLAARAGEADGRRDDRSAALSSASGEGGQQLLTRNDRDRRQAARIVRPHGAGRCRPALIRFYERLRAEAPMYRMPGAGFWLVTTYELCREVMRQPDLFASGVSPMALKPSGVPQEVIDLYTNEGWLPTASCSTSDPPATHLGAQAPRPAVHGIQGARAHAVDRAPVARADRWLRRAGAMRVRARLRASAADDDHRRADRRAARSISRDSRRGRTRSSSRSA